MNIQQNRSFFNQLWGVFKPYWTSREKWTAFLLLGCSIGCVAGDIGATVGFNAFHRDFYNALQHFDKSGIIISLIHFCFMFFLYSASLTGSIYFARLLQVRWRRWLTTYYLDKWSDYRANHSKHLTDDSIDNPDQRISEDLDKFPEISLQLFNKFLHSSLMLFSFSYILWHLSDHLGVIPGYFCLIALGCAIGGTVITHWIGKKLVSLDYQQQRYNADFRFDLVKLRETDNKIMMDQNKLKNLFSYIFVNFSHLITLKAKLNLFTRNYDYIYYVLSFLVSIPFYLAKQISLGAVTQISSAFNSTASGFSVFVEAFQDIADWRATTMRIIEFHQALEGNHLIDTQHTIQTIPTTVLD